MKTRINSKISLENEIKKLKYKIKQITQERDSQLERLKEIQKDKPKDNYCNLVELNQQYLNTIAKVKQCQRYQISMFKKMGQVFRKLKWRVNYVLKNKIKKIKKRNRPQKNNVQLHHQSVEALRAPTNGYHQTQVTQDNDSISLNVPPAYGRPDESLTVQKNEQQIKRIQSQQMPDPDQEPQLQLSPPNSDSLVEKQQMENKLFQILIKSMPDNPRNYVENNLRNQKQYCKITEISAKNRSYLPLGIDYPQDSYFLGHQFVMIKFEQFIQYDWSKVFVLNLINCQIDDEGFKMLAQNGHRFPNLKVILISRNKICKLTAEMIQNFKSLQYISFGQERNSLRKIDYNRNIELTDQSLKQLIKYLHNNPKKIVKCYQLNMLSKQKRRHFTQAIISENLTNNQKGISKNF